MSLKVVTTALALKTVAKVVTFLSSVTKEKTSIKCDNANDITNTIIVNIHFNLQIGPISYS